MKTICFLVGLVFLSTSFARDFRPEGHLENIPAMDSSVQECYVFRTLPGVRYRVESSHDLSQWTIEDEIYGLGHEYVVAMREFTPPPPPEPGSDPPASLIAATKQVSLFIQPSSEGADDTVVSWKSLDHGGPVVCQLGQLMTSGWNQLPLFWNNYGDFGFFILHAPSSVPPPEENPPLDPLDAAMFAELGNSFAAMNQAIDDSVARTRNTPSPASADPESRKFWRVQCDWSIDTDLDGSPDWVEIEMAANMTSGPATQTLTAPGASASSSRSSGATPNPFNSDTNNDGIPDGEQQDYDNDGVMDAFDIAYQDATATFEIGPLPRYALFPINSSVTEALSPLQISDRGTVLFRTGTWSAGVWTPLDIPADGLNVGWEGPRAINDHDVILGVFELSFHDDISDSWEGGCGFCSWDSPTAPWKFVTRGSGDDEMYAVEPEDDYHRRKWLAPGPVLSNEGYFSAFTYGRNLDQPQKYFTILRPSYWKLAADESPATELESDHRLLYSLGPSLRWGGGWPLDSEANGFPEEDFTQPYEERFYAPDPITPPDFTPSNAAQIPSDRILGIPWGDEWDAQVHYDGTWHPSPTFAKAIDIAADGTAIGKAHDGKTAPILLNGKWTSIKRYAPTDTDVFDPPPAWHDEAVSLLDTTPGGWVLARRYDYTTEQAVMLPIRAEGYYVGSDGVALTSAVGVDDFSIGSASPGNEVGDRIWIMAPQGGFNKIVKLKAPLNSNTPLTLSASNILFSGQEDTTISAALSAVTLRASDTVSSGGERLMSLAMGTGNDEVSSLSKPIGLKIMKDRTVNVTVYKVTKLYGSNAEEEVDPLVLPTQQEITNHLKDVFRPQINAVFNVNLVDMPLKVRWDANNNAIFEVQTGSGDPGEEATILEEIPPIPSDYNIRVFLVANSAPLSSGIDAYGLTDVANATCWVLGSKFGKNRNPQFLMETIGHEVGHVLVGKGHPDIDQNPGLAPLPGTKHTFRLMCSGPNSIDSSQLLVKREWDEAERWLKPNIDDKEPQ